VQSFVTFGLIQREIKIEPIMNATIISKSSSLQSVKSFRIEDGLVIEEVLTANQEIAEEEKMTPEPETIVELPTPNVLVKSDAGRAGTDLDPRFNQPGMNSQCKLSLYGQPTAKSQLTIPQLKEYFDFNMKKRHTDIHNGHGDANHDDEYYDLYEKGGLVWYSTIIPNNYNENYHPKALLKKGKLKVLPVKFYDEKNECIKARRGNLAVTENDFFTSLIKINCDDDDDDDESTTDYSEFQIFDKKDDVFNETKKKQYSRWIFSGVLNGWPGLKYLELVEIQYKGTVDPRWKSSWESENNPKDIAPSHPKNVGGMTEVRVKLREPGWSAEGWSKESPGYVFWYNSPETNKVPRILYGTDIINQFEKDRYDQANKLEHPMSQVEPSPKCVRVHMISHRYATKTVGLRDKLAYHSFALLEWDHAKHCTVIELSLLNGLGGYHGRSLHAVVRHDNFLFEYLSSCKKCMEFIPFLIQLIISNVSPTQPFLHLRIETHQESLLFVKLLHLKWSNHGKTLSQKSAV
jgi:hypothetical protein